MATKVKEGKMRTYTVSGQTLSSRRGTSPQGTTIKNTKRNEITLDDVKKIVKEAIDEKFEEYFGDPDAGLEVREEVIEQLKAQRKAKKPRIPMEQVAKKYGYELQ